MTELFGAAIGVLSIAVVIVSIFVCLGVMVFVIVDAIRGTDLPRLEAMRASDPKLFRGIVFVARVNGAMCGALGILFVLLGLGMVVIGIGSLDLIAVASLFLLVGSGIAWYCLRLCSWAWRTEFE